MALQQERSKAGSGVHCAVNGCSWNQRKLNALLIVQCFDHKPLVKKNCPCAPPYKLHRMPDDPDVKRQWLAALQRKHPPKNVFVCSYHFVNKQPTAAHPLPELNLGYKRIVKSRRVLVRCTESTNDAENIPAEKSISGRRKRKASSAPDVSPAKQSCFSVSELDSATNDQDYQNQNEGTGMPESSEKLLAEVASSPEPITPPELSSSDKQTQWEDFSLEHHDYCKKSTQVKHQACQCDLAEEETVPSQLIKTNSDAKLYVGIQRDTFVTLVDCMRQFAKVNWKMPVEDQILMTLMKLKLNLLIADLSHRFCVSEGLVSKTIKFWIDTLAKHLTGLIVWLPWETIKATMPSCFKRYPKTTCILDCAETFLQKPSNLKSRGQSYSNYKSHNTVKYCVTIAPCGLIMHISRACGGRASDKYIVQDSKILNRLVPGDEVMADRGFTIQDLLFPLQVKLNIPAFSHGKQLSNEEITRTRRVANVRIHVERAIRRLKVFKILKDIVPVSLTRHIDKILRICAALVNLNPALIREKNKS